MTSGTIWEHAHKWFVKSVKINITLPRSECSGFHPIQRESEKFSDEEKQLIEQIQINEPCITAPTGNTAKWSDSDSAEIKLIGMCSLRANMGVT